MDDQQTQPIDDTAKALARSPRRDIAGLLQGPEFKMAVQAALPKHLTADRFIRVALTATMRQPELLQCTRESFFRALLDLSALGIEADGRRAHLIPFWNNQMCGVCNHKKDDHRGKCSKCACPGMQSARDVQLIIDYKGIAELVRRSGDVSYIHADVVYEKDTWDFCFGSGAFLKHRPNLENRGAKVVAVYSFVKLKDGSEDFIVLSYGDVEKVRSRSKAKDSGPWKTDWDEMAKKTAFRRHSKWLPLSPETRDATEKDDEFAGVDMEEAMAGAERMHGTVTLDSFSASEDPNRGHEHTAPTDKPDPEKSEGPKAEPKLASQPKPRQSTTKPVEKPAEVVEDEPVHDAAPIRRYARGEMPDAMEVSIGTEAYHEGRHFRAVRVDGSDFDQKWQDIGPEPTPKVEAAEQRATTGKAGFHFPKGGK